MILFFAFLGFWFRETVASDCGNSKCWEWNAVEGKCELNGADGCFELDCQWSGIELLFTADLFGMTADAMNEVIRDDEDVKWIYRPDEKQFYVNCPFVNVPGCPLRLQTKMLNGDEYLVVELAIAPVVPDFKFKNARFGFEAIHFYRKFEVVAQTFKDFPPWFRQ